jgi:L-2,4-diaminobutyric acid acetyltransferase
MPKDIVDIPTETLRFRKPDPSDGADIWNLIKSCKPLDENSMYAYLIQAEHFGETCVVAEYEGEIAGWVSGHIIPETNELFVWQVAVGPQARGLGLGKKMLSCLIERDPCEHAEALKTTITRDNAASWALFESVARAVGGEMNAAPHFERDAHFDGRHATEHMVTITLPKAGSLRRAA